MLKPRTIIAKYLLVYYLIRYEGRNHVAGNEGTEGTEGQDQGGANGVPISGQGSSTARQVAATLSGTQQQLVSAPDGTGIGSGEDISGPAIEEHKIGEGSSSPSSSTEKTVTLVDPANLIEVDVENKITTDKIDYYQKENDNTDVFAAKDPHFFFKIKKGNEVLWESKSEVYPKKVYAKPTSTGKTKLRLFYPKGTHISLDAQNSFNLNVNYKQTNNFYEHAHNDEESLDSFKCKQGYKIRLLQKGPHVLWEKEAAGEYAVEVDVFTMQDNKLAIVIYLEGGRRLICYKQDPEAEGAIFKCEEEDDIKLVSSSTTKPPPLQLFTQGSSSANDSNKFDHEKKDKMDHYTFKDDAKCTEIKVGQDSLWRYSSDDKYPKKVSHYFNLLVVTFNNEEKFIYIKRDDHWEHSIGGIEGTVGADQSDDALIAEAAPAESQDPNKIESIDLDDFEIVDSRDQSKSSPPLTQTQPSKPEDDGETGEDIDLTGGGGSGAPTTVPETTPATKTTPETSTSTGAPEDGTDGTTGTSAEGTDGTSGSDGSGTDASGTDGTTGADGSGTTPDGDASGADGTDGTTGTATAPESGASTTPDPSGTATSESPDATSGGQDQSGTDGTSTDADGSSAPESGSDGTTGGGKDGTTGDPSGTAGTSADQDGSGTSSGQDQEGSSSAEGGTDGASTGGDGSGTTGTSGGDQDGTAGTATTPDSTDSSGEGTTETTTVDQDSTGGDATSTGGGATPVPGASATPVPKAASTTPVAKSASAAPVARAAAATPATPASQSTPVASSAQSAPVAKAASVSSSAQSGPVAKAASAAPAVPVASSSTASPASRATPVAKAAPSVPGTTATPVASTAQPRSRSAPSPAGSARQTGGISISLDDDEEDLIGSPQNPERWIRASAMLKLSYYPLYKFVPSLEISTLDPNDPQKNVVNDTNCYETSHEKGNIIYKFKSDTKCVLIKADGKDLWKREQGEDKAEIYPQYIVTVTKFVFVVFEGYFKLYKVNADNCSDLFESMPTLKLLNIKKTDEKFYNYTKDDKAKIYIYTAKNEVLFNSVKKLKGSCGGTTTDIWDTKYPEEYATKVIRKESGKKDKYLCVYHYNGNYSLLFKRKGAKLWEDRTSEKFYPSEFRFHTLNEKGTQCEELETSKREIEVDGFIKRYKFVDGAKCHEIRCRNVKLWRHDKIKFGDDYPKQMALNMLTNEVTVKLNEISFVYKYKENDTVWELEAPTFGDYYMKRLVVVTVDENGTNSSENNTNRYELNKYGTGLVYKIKGDSKFVEVKNGARSLWKHVDGSEHPRILYHDIKNNKLFVRFKDTLGICNAGDSKSVKAGEEAPEVDKLVLVTLDESGNRKENEIKDLAKKRADGSGTDPNEGSGSTDATDGSGTDHKESGESGQTPENGSTNGNQTPPFTKETMDKESKMIHRYRFGDRVRCVEVKVGGESLWSYEINKHGREYPKEVVLNLEMSTLTVNFDSQLNYIYVHDGESWKLDSENNLLDYYMGKFTIVTADDGEGTNSRENDELEYTIEHQNSVFSFFMLEQAKCIKVKYEEQVVWSHKKEEPERYATSVSCNPQSGSLAIDTEGATFRYYKENGVWIQGFDPSLPLPPEKHPQGFTIVTLEQGTENTVENDLTQYGVYDRGIDCYLFHFPEGSRCVEFKFDGRNIWSHHLKYKQNYPESITVDLKSGIVEIEIGDKSLTYQLYQQDE
ncbi:uncharacterized protein TOT_010001164 [Theileria orientalis strain Shintoku]|uniref:Uncharacterized protein n=1 Tax=Theileria orientalis strain Shintoku TaxID=869250 RepID=J4D6P8_THEOR|nr:uncharacterized protein TOT_010001164 [Theileria orientalis strain Shintoku]BAM39710.1 uncharacterized protein TOT_010001164 [Theileria orientalis strain Shintoku]|eukprot:XP_009690011.1 uncharacterized protein TOT_010001164 [Theileria orientalis strain Shintoku]